MAFVIPRLYRGVLGNSSRDPKVLPGDARRSKGTVTRPERVCFSCPEIGITPMHIELNFADPSIRQNSRINDQAVEAVMASIREFGFRHDRGGYRGVININGHTRFKAAVRLELAKVPVHATDLTPRRSWPPPRRRPDRPRRRARAARRGDHAARRPVDPRRPPPALRRQQQARGRRPAARRRPDPPGQHRPALQREGRAALEQRHRRRQQLVRRPGKKRTHHQSLDLARHPEKSKPTDEEDAGQGPAAGQRLRVRRGVRPAARRLVRQHRPRAGARPRLLHLGRLRQLRQLPAGPEEARPLLLPGRSSGTRSTRS